MHILVVALHRPNKPTGVCRHAANLARCLAATNEVTQITLVIGDWQNNYFKTAFSLDSDKIKLLDVKIKNSSLSRNFWFLRGLPKLVDKLEPDLVHLSFPLPFLRSRFSCPVVSTIHDLYPYECPENFGLVQAFFNRYFLKWCIQESTGLSCVSQVTLNLLQGFFPQLKSSKILTVIYNYVDFDNISTKVLSTIESSLANSYLLCVAQHRKNKNLDLLIKSYHSLRDKGLLEHAIKLIIVGSSGPETPKLQALIHSLNLEKEVLLISAVEDAELCWLYQNCKLFIIPSTTEGFCIPLVEALNFDCSVVCSDTPIFREIGDVRCHYFDLKHKPIENLNQAIQDTLKYSPSKHVDKDYRFTKLKASDGCLAFYEKALNHGHNE